MICENCGKEIENNSGFCGYCGCPTSKMIRPMFDEEETAETPDNQNSKKKKNGQKKVLLIAVFVIAFILIAVAIIGFLIWRATKENASFSFGELSVDEIYFIAGEKETATFTVQAPDATGTIYLCDDNGKSAEKMTDDGENGDSEADDGVYTCVISVNSDEKGEASYYAKGANCTSDSVTVYFFDLMTEDEEEEAMEIVDEVSKELREIEAGYAGESGYVTTDDCADIFSEAEVYLETKVADETILLYIIEDSSIYIKFNSGISFCYQPTLEDTFSGEDDIELTISYYQPCDGDYIADCEETMSDPISYIENLSSGNSYTEKDVTLEMVKNLPSDSIAVWYGHGGYSGSTGSYVIMATREQDYSADTWLEKVKDLVRDNLTTAYVEGDDKAHIAFTAGFVNKYCGDLSNDIIFLSCCKGGMDTRLANSFISCGASAVLCFTNSVFCSYAESIIDGMLLHMMYAWPESEWYYTIDQALEYVKDKYGENDEIWRQTYLQTSSTSPCYAEPLLVTGTTASGGSGRGTELRLSTETGSLSGTAWYYGEEITEPAAGATVSLYQGGDLYMSVTTDENGEYSIPLLPAGAYDIVFSLEGYSDYYLDGAGVYRDQLTEAADGYFLEKGTIIGMAIDGVTGELLPDTEVKLTIETDDSIYIQTTSTDENGNFLIDLTKETEMLSWSDVTDSATGQSDSGALLKNIVPIEKKSYVMENGYIEVIEETGTLKFSLAGYEEKELEVTTVAAGEMDLGTIELMPEIEIYGYVYDEDGNTLEDVSVTVFMPETKSKETEETDDSKWWLAQTTDEEDDSVETESGDETVSEYIVTDEMQTDETGIYETDCYASVESIMVTCSLDGYATATVEMTLDVALIEDGRLQLDDIVLERPKIIGTVVDAANGEALPGVTITVTGDSTDTITLESESDGTFRQRMEALGTYTVTFEMEGYESTSVQATLTDSAHADLGTISLAKISDEELTSGVYVYATSVISFESGDPWTSKEDAMDPSEALGAPDYSNDKYAVTLGAGGVLTLAFDVAVCDGEGIDIYVYECGEDVEPTLVEVSNDLVNWTVVGTAEGALSGVDINGMVPEGATYQYVRLTDLGYYPGGEWPGADIDAVAIVNYQ